MDVNAVQPAQNASVGRSTGANTAATQQDEAAGLSERLAREARQSEQSTRAQEVRQAQRSQQTQAANEAAAAEQARAEARRAAPTVNAQGQTVGTRVNTTA